MQVLPQVCIVHFKLKFPDMDDIPLVYDFLELIDLGLRRHSNMPLPVNCQAETMELLHERAFTNSCGSRCVWVGFW